MFKCIECEMEDVEVEGDMCDDCMYEDCDEDEDMFEDEE